MDPGLLGLAEAAKGFMPTVEGLALYEAALTVGGHSIHRFDGAPDRDRFLVGWRDVQPFGQNCPHFVRRLFDQRTVAELEDNETHDGLIHEGIGEVHQMGRQRDPNLVVDLRTLSCELGSDPAQYADHLEWRPVDADPAAHATLRPEQVPSNVMT